MCVSLYVYRRGNRVGLVRCEQRDKKANTYNTLCGRLVRQSTRILDQLQLVSLLQQHLVLCSRTVSALMCKTNLPKTNFIFCECFNFSFLQGFSLSIYTNIYI